MIPKYIFVEDDSSHDGRQKVFYSNEELTPADLEGAEVGTGVIIRLADMHSMGIGGEWRPIAEGVQVIPDPEETSGRPFHVHPDTDKDYFE